MVRSQRVTTDSDSKYDVTSDNNNNNNNNNKSLDLVLVVNFEESKTTSEGAEEGQQLSPGTAANSCSYWKLSAGAGGADRTTEMAQEDVNTPCCWNNLPSVILFEIFSYLPHDEKIKTSQVCRNWRYALFHPCFWKNITFTLDVRNDDNVPRARFLADYFAHSVREVVIKCDTASYFVDETSRLLHKLSNNIHLRKIYLEPSSCTFDWPARRANNRDEGRLICTPVLEPLLKIVKRTMCLQALSLGCAEDLAANSGVILDALQYHHAKNLTHLSLASVKEDPDGYILLELDTFVFRSFVRLSVLTIDYDNVSDILLQALDNGLMERLVIHVHGLDDDHPGTTNNAWMLFVHKNPRCELRLNLLHSYDAVTVLDSEILRPAMPLAELKVLFCETVNVRALHQLSSWYPKTLRSIVWIDCIDLKPSLPVTYESDSPDPLVLIAWTCTKLKELVFLGYKYFQDELLAITRLRGPTLKRLEFAERDILIDESCSAKATNNEISEIMGGFWQPLSDAELPPVVMDPLNGNSIEVIMPMVLSDQK